MDCDHEDILSATHTASNSSHTIITAFQQHLLSIRRQNWEGREFYSPSEIRQWMQSKPTGHQAQSNLARLLDEAQASTPRLRRANEVAIKNNQILFAILLDTRLKCGHLVHGFKHAITDDAHLPKLGDREFEALQHVLKGENRDIPVEQLLETFKIIRWEYCPIRMDNNMMAFLTPYEILPFCQRLPINKKGGEYCCTPSQFGIPP